MTLERYFDKSPDKPKKIEGVSFNLCTTYFRLPPWNPCESCGKSGEIVSGLPTWLQITIPISKDDLDLVTPIPFFIAGDFEIACFNGHSHIAKGLAPTKRFIVSEFADINKGYVETGKGFEPTLLRFLTNLANIVRQRKRIDEESGTRLLALNE